MGPHPASQMAWTPRAPLLHRMHRSIDFSSPLAAKTTQTPRSSELHKLPHHTGCVGSSGSPCYVGSRQDQNVQTLQASLPHGLHRFHYSTHRNRGRKRKLEKEEGSLETWRATERAVWGVEPRKEPTGSKITHMGPTCHVLDNPDLEY